MKRYIEYIKLIKELKDETYQSAIDKFDSNRENIQRKRDDLNIQKNAMLRQIRKLDNEKSKLSRRSSTMNMWLKNVDRKDFNEKYKLSLERIQNIIDSGFNYDIHTHTYHILAFDTIGKQAYDDSWDMDYELSGTTKYISEHLQHEIQNGQISKMFMPRIGEDEDYWDEEEYWDSFWDKLDRFITPIESVLEKVVVDMRTTWDGIYEIEEDDDLTINNFNPNQINRHEDIKEGLRRAKFLINGIKKEIFDEIVMIDKEDLDPNL